MKGSEAKLLQYMECANDTSTLCCGLVDVKVLLNQGEIEYISTGRATGDNRVVDAFTEMINNPLVGTSLGFISSSLYVVEGGFDLSVPGFRLFHLLVRIERFGKYLCMGRVLNVA